MNADQLAAIEARAATATNGPWEAVHENSGSYILYRGEPTPYHSTGVYYLVKRGGFAKGTSRQDVDLIAHAREDIPALLAEVRRLREMVAASNDICEDGPDCPILEAP